MIETHPFLIRVADGQPSVSATYRNKQCLELGPDLESEYHGCRTTYQVFMRRVGLSPGDRCLGWRPIAEDGAAGAYHFMTYRQVGDRVACLARALALEGFKSGDHIGIYGINSPEWVMAMIACSAIGAVCVPLYDTLGADSVQYVMQHSDMAALFVAAPKLGEVAQALEQIDGAGPAQAASPTTGAPSAADHSTAVPSAEYHSTRASDSADAFDSASSAGASGDGPSVSQYEEAALAVASGGGSAGAPAGAPAGQHVRTVRTVVVWGAEGTETSGTDVQASQRLTQVGRRVWPFDELLNRGAHPVSSDTPAAAALLGMTPATDPNSICTIYYTSGTTGVPKGVVISHRALVSVVCSQLRFLLNEDSLEKFEPGDAHLSYLPLAHVYERAAVEAALALGACIGFWQGAVDKLADDAQALQPAIMIGVPRVWDRVMAGALDKINKRPLGIAKFLYRVLYAHKLRRMLAGRRQHQASALADALLFKKIKAALGGRLKIVISGAAPLTPETECFIRTCLCCVAGQGYGLTETCSATCVFVPDRMDMLGTVGPVATCAEFRLESVPDMGYDAVSDPPRGELLIRGPCLFSGYHKNPAATAEVIDADGFFHTGDIAELTPSGALRIIDRRKNIFKLAQGEYVSVERVEVALRSCPLVSNVWVTGQSTERYPVAVVVPHEQRLMEWARLAGVPGTNLAAVLATPEAHSHVLQGLTAAARQSKLRSFECVAGVLLEEQDFTVESGLVTPTFKLKRHQLQQHYAAPLAQLYQQLRTAGPSSLTHSGSGREPAPQAAGDAGARSGLLAKKKTQ